MKYRKVLTLNQITIQSFITERSGMKNIKGGIETQINFSCLTNCPSVDPYPYCASADCSGNNADCDPDQKKVRLTHVF